VPSGWLTLTITNVSSVRQNWSETANRRAEDLLNKFVIGLVRAALGVKRQRAEAERREKERQEAERLRQEEARRAAEAELRWREEQVKVERLEQLAKLWKRNRQIRGVVSELQTAVGEVPAESELGQWLAWAADHAERSDPFRRLRARQGATLTLYYHGYDYDSIPERGFKEPDFTGYGNEKVKSGVELTNRPPRRGHYEHAMKVELPEDLALPFEWPQESDWYWRVFRVPAAVLNRVLGYPVGAGAQAEAVDVDDS
jgi:hypothetical protein